MSVGAEVLLAMLGAQSSQLNSANEANVCACCRSSRAASSTPSSGARDHVISLHITLLNCSPEFLTLLDLSDTGLQLAVCAGPF